MGLTGRSVIGVIGTFAGLVSSTADGATFHVPSEYSTIRSAIETAVEGDTIWVAPGEYIDEGVEKYELKGGVAVLAESQQEDTIWGVWEGIIVARWEAAETPATIRGFQLWYETWRTDAIAVYNGGVVVEDCAFVDQGPWGAGGGAILLSNGSSGIIRSNVFLHGGAVTIDINAGVDALIERNLFMGCLGDPGLASIYISQQASNIELRHNTFGEHSHGVDANANPVVEVTVEIVLNGNLFYGPGLPTFTCYGDAAGEIGITASYNFFEQSELYGCDGAVFGPGNVFDLEDAMYCDPETCDLSLHVDSPAVGAGEDGADVGALGVGCGIVGVPGDVHAIAPNVHASPNPTTGRVEIALPIEFSNSSLVLEVYDAAGRLVQRQLTGGQRVAWDGRHNGSLSSGVYFLRLNTLRGVQVYSERITVLE
jgi:hypothetical protein